MRSAREVRDADRTTRARIRDAAITKFSEDGVAATSVRAIAAAAGVSPALVIHHFGSKDALRVECDRHVATIINEQKTTAMRAGASLDPVAALREYREGPPILRYLARTLVDGSPHVAELVNQMVDDASKYMAEGVEAGLLRPTTYHYERAAVLTIWSLGALVLHEHLARLIGVRLIDYPNDPAAGAAYVRPAFEMLTEGVINPDMAAGIREVFVDGDEPVTEASRPAKHAQDRLRRAE
jgi:AcrR family transcriptional regulator